MKNDMDYLNYDDLNKVENDIETKTNEIKVTSTIPTYKKKNWVVDELPYIEEIDRIEKGVENLGEYTEKPNNWKPTKQWANDDGSYGLKSFDYHDYNRWLKDISLIDTTNLDKDTYWNGFSLVNWDETSKYDWTEKKQDRTFKGIIIKLFSKIKRMIKFIRLKGFTKQEKTEGYNLFNFSKTEVVERNGQYIYKDNIARIKNPTNYSYFPSNFASIVDTTTGKQITIAIRLNGSFTYENYSLSVNFSTNKNAYAFQFKLNESKTYNNEIKAKTLQLASDEFLKYGNIYLQHSITCDLQVEVFMQIGNKITAYEPYTGGTASPNPEYPQEIEVGKGNIEVKSTGKNLFDKDNAEFVKGFFAGGNEIAPSELDRIIYIKCKPNTTYTITKALNKETAKNRLSVATTNEKPVVGTLLVNQKLNPDGTTKKSESITTANNSNYLIVFIYTESAKQTFEELLSSVMIYEGTAVTSYEPYRESKVQYALQDNFLAEKDYIINGKLFKNTAEYVFTGDEDISLVWDATTDTVAFIYYQSIPQNEYEKGCLCNDFVVYPRQGIDINQNIEFLTKGNNYYAIRIFKKRLTDLSAQGFKTWLKDKYNSGNPVKVLYETATTTEIPLKTTGELTLDKGDNIISNSIDTENTIGYEEE